MKKFDIIAFRVILESFANVSVTLAELLESDPELGAAARDLAASPDSPTAIARLKEKILQYSDDQSLMNVDELAVRSLAVSALSLIKSTPSGEQEYESESIGALTASDWSDARVALGRGSKWILFGTSDRTLDLVSDSLRMVTTVRA